MLLPADFEQEILKLEKLLMEGGATIETPYDETFIAQKRRELRQHGISLLTIQVEPDEMTIHRTSSRAVPDQLLHGSGIRHENGLE
jgi:hypothetical protein